MRPRNVTRRLKGGSLFSGYGGLDLAVEAALGTRLTWVSEIDASPSRILEQQFPGVPNLGDITAVDWSAVEPVDVLTGGFPCQDLSTAGGRAGLREGTRSGLWYEMARAIDTLRPRLVIAENVRGLLSAEADSDVEPCSWCMGEAGDGEPPMRALGAVLADLAGLGYDAAWCGLRAAEVGAPHGRFRVFVLAWDATADTRGEAGKQWPGLRTDDTARHWRGLSTRSGRETAQVTLLPTPKATNNENRQSLDRYGMNLGMALDLLPTPTVNDMGAGKTVEDWDAWTARMKSAHGNGNGHGKSLSIETQRLAVGDLMPTPSVADVEGGRKHRSGARSAELLLNGLAHAQAFGQYAPAIARWEAYLGRPAPAPTEPTGKGGAHRLSPRFVEWMMGLPDGWVTDTNTTRNEQLKALGNGVVPQQAAAAIRHLLTVRATVTTTQPVAP